MHIDMIKMFENLTLDFLFLFKFNIICQPINNFIQKIMSIRFFRLRNHEPLTSTTIDTLPKKNNSFVSNYELRQTIGTGASARVRRAIHIPTGIPVAAKIIKFKSLTETKRHRLELQIQINKHLQHQNIAQIFEVCQTADKLFIFMEYCSNGELFTYINDHGPLSKQRSIQIFNQLLSAVMYLHENKICHRDIKPENILLDENFNIKLIDFGLANLYENKEEGKQELMKTFCGSPSYLSPEMVSKTAYTPELIDVWCLGVTLYTMVTAQLPFYDEDPKLERNNIIRLKYKPTSYPDINELLCSMLDTNKNRIKLSQLRQTQILKKHSCPTPNKLSPEEQMYAIDHELIERISNENNIPSEIIIKSLTTRSLDQNYSIYFLEMIKQRTQGLYSIYDIHSPGFMSKRKSPMLVHKKKNSQKLSESQCMTKKSCSTKKTQPAVSTERKILKKKNIFEPDFQRLIREESPQSPKRIMSNTKKYQRKAEEEDIGKIKRRLLDTPYI